MSSLVSQQTHPAAISPHSGHTIVCGLHDVGLRVVEQLQAAGENVLVIDDGSDARLGRIADSLGVARVIGDSRRVVTLREAGIDTAQAVICVENGDLHNLGVALLVRKLHPELRLVVSLTNAAVGRAVQRLTGPGTVLDVAALAAPTFVESCTRRRHHTLQLGGTEFVVAEQVVTQGGRLRLIFGDLAPIAVVRTSEPVGSDHPGKAHPGKVKTENAKIENVQIENAEIEICPGRDLQVQPGDRVTVIGPADEFQEVRSAHASDEQERRRQRLHNFREIVLSMLTETSRSLWLALLGLFGIGLASMVLLMNFYVDANGRHMTPISAAYFTTETLTTVGFGDFSFAHQHTWLRLWAIVLMILGATLVAVVYAMLTNVLIGRRMEASAGRRAATGLTGHVILIGLGAVGMRVLEGLLAEDREVVVLERDENNRFLGAARALHVPIIIGDSTVAQNLIAANLAHAGAVAVLTSNDMANIETGLAVDDLLAERASEVPVVLRIFDRLLARTVEEGFGFQHVRSTSELASPWFVGAALGLDVLNTFYVDHQPFLVGRLTIAEGGGLAGARMQELSARTRVVAIDRLGGSLEYPPRRDTTFEAGDQAYLVGPYEELLELLHHEQRG